MRLLRSPSYQGVCTCALFKAQTNAIRKKNDLANEDVNALLGYTYVTQFLEKKTMVLLQFTIVTYFRKMIRKWFKIVVKSLKNNKK